MNNAQLLSALQAKMAAEQEKFQDWLLTQSPEEILNHTFEYSTREDIVLLMDDIRLSNDDLKILLSSPTPLADVYKILSNTDTGLLDTIQAGRMREAARHNSMAIPQRSSVLDKLQTKAPEAPKPPSPKKEHGAR